MKMATSCGIKHFQNGSVLGSHSSRQEDNQAVGSLYVGSRMKTLVATITNPTHRISIRNSAPSIPLLWLMGHRKFTHLIAPCGTPWQLKIPQKKVSFYWGKLPKRVVDFLSFSPGFALAKTRMVFRLPNRHNDRSGGSQVEYLHGMVQGATQMNATRRLATLLLVSVSIVLTPVAARAQDEDLADQTQNESLATEDQDPGQTDLNQAITAKLAANDYEGMTNVINLVQAALNKGLDEENTKFAKKLLAATLMDRATLVSLAILNRQNPNPRWPQLRQAAVADLKRLIGIDPSLPQAHYMMGRLLALPGGDPAGAIRSLGKAIDAEGVDDSLRVKALTLRGNLQSDEEKRLADYNAAVKIDISDPEPLRTRALYYLLKGKTDEAIVDLDRALEIDPDHAATLEARGLALFAKKSYEESKASFDRALEINPKSATLRMNRARLFIAQGDTEAAIDDLDQGLEINPNEVKLLLFRAQVRLANKDRDGALVDIDEIVRLRPGNIAALRMRAEVLAGSERMDEAIAGLERLAQLLPDNPELMLQLGIYYNSNKQPRRAIKIFDGFLAENDKNWQALRSRGDAYLSIGKQAEALADYEAALKLQPENSGVLNNLSWVLATAPEEKLRDGSRALQLVIKACELTEYKQAHMLSTLAAAHAEKGDFKEAIKWSEKAVELGKGQHGGQLAKELESYKAGKPWRELQSIEEKEPEEPSDEAEPDEAEPDEVSDFE